MADTRRLESRKDFKDGPSVGFTGWFIGSAEGCPSPYWGTRSYEEMLELANQFAHEANIEGSDFNE